MCAAAIYFFINDLRSSEGPLSIQYAGALPSRDGLLLLLSSLLDGLIGLRHDELDVARVRHVGVDL